MIFQMSNFRANIQMITIKVTKNESWKSKRKDFFLNENPIINVKNVQIKAFSLLFTNSR